MRTSQNHILILFILLLAGFKLFAQQEPSLKNLQTISESEKNAHLLLLKPHEQLIENNYDLKYHRFFWFADPAKTFISGSVTSHFVAAQSAMSSIQFELSSGMSVDSSFYHGTKFTVNHTGNVITVPLGTTIPAGTLDSVTVYYNGNPTNTGFGSFGNEIHSGAPAMWTLSEPYGASDWWPSKNDLTDKIDSIDVFVVTPTGNHVASNGLLISETPYGIGSTLAHWKHRYPIVSYLIAIASTNYARFSDYYSTGTDSLEVLNYVYPEDSVILRNNAKSVLPSIALFEKLYGPYPFRAEKYGHAQFGWGGGMEHQTMTFLSKGAFNPEIIAHELAHQWFGDMITCGSWRDIWLNEGFATYSAGLMYENSSDYYWKVWKFNNISNICRYPGGSVFCTDTTSVGRIFDGRLSYSKGAMLLHMLRWVVGDDDFFAGIKSYVNDPHLKHGFALSDDFITHMETTSGQNLTGFFDDWLYGEGFPTYTVTVEPLPDHNASVTIKQSQSHASVDFFEMPVPIKFFGEGKDTVIVFNHSYSGEVFLVNTGFAVDSMKIDPDQWLVSAKNSISFALSVGTLPSPASKIFSLLPNPANDFIYVQHSPDTITALEIITMDGKSISVNYTEDGKYLLKIDIQNLRSGIYILRLGNAEGIVTMKFIVKH